MKTTPTTTAPDSVVPFKIKFDRLFHARVKALATVQQTTTHNLIEVAVSDYVKKHWDDRIGEVAPATEERGVANHG